VSMYCQVSDRDTPLVLTLYLWESVA
jgi:hypothetical protein